jgi:TonB-linked SusC/RagA family outer membrane protein
MYLNSDVKKNVLWHFFSVKILRPMKITVFIIAFACMQAVAGSYAQVINLSENNVKLHTVFTQIKKQTNYKFFYKGITINNIKVSANLTNASIDDALTQILKDQPFTYTLVNKVIIIRSKQPDGPPGSQLALVADITVKGRVSDKNNLPLPGVTIRLRGTTKGIITDVNGNYTIDAPEGAILEFSSIGYVLQALQIKGPKLDVQMPEDNQRMNEIVVVGYGTVEKKDLTGAVSSISSKDLENKPIARFDQMLQGKATGVDVKSTNGAPGSGTSIRIRGSRSISATNEPLYVIDGLIDATNLNTINPEDIESIDILKDASATAIYGSRAANGVVIVTTKKGKAGKNVSAFSSIVGIQTLPDYLKLMNARQFAEFINESRLDEARPVLYPDVDAIVAKVGEAGTNWTKATTHPAAYATYNLSTSGGDKKMTYFMSGNIINQDGIIKNSGFNKYQGRINLNKNFNDKLTFGLVLNASHYRIDQSNVNFGSNSGWIGSMITMPPTMQVYKADGSFESYNPIYYSGGDMDSAPATAALTENYNTVNDLQNNMFLELQPIAGLRIKSAFGTSLSTNRANYFVPTYMPSKIATNTQTASGSSNTGSSVYIQNENTVTYDHRFNQHHLNLLGGFTYEHKNSNTMGISVSGLTDDIMRYNNFSAAPQANRTTTSGYDEFTRLSYLSRVNYDFASKYYLTATGRYDGASNFAADHKWGFFPSFGAKWRASEETFFQDINTKKVISNLDFRLSYGLSGNQGIGDYQSIASLASNSNSYIFGGNQVLGFTPNQLANPNLTWETSAQLDIGADIEFFNGRLSIDANYYKINAHDLLLQVQIPTQTGFGTRLINLGKSESKGFEFMVSGDIIRTRNFTWNSTFTLSTNEQKVLDLGPLLKTAVDNNGYGANTNYLDVGFPMGANYGVDYAGVWHNQAEINAELAKPAGQRTMVSTSAFYKPGKPRYFDYNHDGQLTADDYHYLGTPNPKLYGGFGNRLSYKNLSLDFFFQYNQGNTMYNDIEFFMGAGAEYTNQFTYMVNRWTPSNPNSDIPAVNSRDNVPNSRFLHDASLIRLKTLQVDYTFKHVLPKVFRQINVFFTGSNLLLFTKYNGFDPEVNKGDSSSSIRAKDDGTYPNARTFAVGVNVGF